MSLRFAAYKLFRTVTGGNSPVDHSLLLSAGRGKLTIRRINEYVKDGARVNSFVINDKNSNGSSVLQRYCNNYEAKPEIVEYLLKLGAFVNFRDKYGNTALSSMFSILNRNKSRSNIVQILLDFGGDPNITDCSGNTSLHDAVKVATLEEVQNLLKYGATRSINRRGDSCKTNPYWGFTPLHALIFSVRALTAKQEITPRAPIALELMINGANANLRTKSMDNYSPIELLKEEFRVLKDILDDSEDLNEREEADLCRRLTELKEIDKIINEFKMD